MALPYGKIPIDVLKEVVFKNLGHMHKEVVLGPSLGVDGAVIDIGNCSLIVSMDPITGALERIGWLAVNVNANDIATFGVEPAFLFSCIMLPEGVDRKTVENICSQMDEAARNLGMAIVGGHCEMTPGITNPIVVGCAMGITEKGNYVTAAGAEKGDKLILTKSAGIEGTAILATDRQERLGKTMSTGLLHSAQKFLSKVSVVKEAITAYKTGGVNAMHDPTEGGVAGGIHEMADASNLGFKVLGDKIAVSPETSKICQILKIDPLMLISSGALLISARPKSSDKITKQLRQKHISASIIGEFVENPRERTITDRKGKAKPLERPTSDHLWKALARE